MPYIGYSCVKSIKLLKVGETKERRQKIFRGYFGFGGESFHYGTFGVFLCSFRFFQVQ